MKLFLTSAGLIPEITEEFFKLLDKGPKEVRLCFIPTAFNPEKDKWYVKKDRKRLLELGFRITEMDLEQEDKNSIKNKLEKFDVIYVEGGNTFYLLKYLKESGFDKIVKSFLNKGGVYIGVSAGSYIVCPTIEAATWKHADRNITKIKDLKSLNLVPFLITAHFEEKYRSVIEKAAGQTKYSIIALNDKQAVLVNGKKVKIIEKWKKIVFNSQKSF